ncbi:GTPase Era [soil metagenome]
MPEPTQQSPESSTPATRAGNVALIGQPNVGKSSLLNRLLEQKLSIVTPLPQTTRERVVGIDTREDVQMIFVDTPGLVDPRYLLHHSMLQTVRESIPDVDAILFLLDAAATPPLLDPKLVDLLRQRGRALLVVLNKIDIATAAQTEAARAWAHETFGVETATVSAVTGEGVEELRGKIASLLPRSPFLYPPDEISSQSVRFFVEELVRETVFELFKQEIPYSVAVKVDEYRENAEPVYIRATVYVERSSQKGILIGEGGAGIRRLGQEARRKIEEFVGAPVYLDLWIKVLPKWRRDPTALRRLGFSVPSTEKR